MIQLQLDSEPSPFNFIWVAASNRGSVVKIDTVTGIILGEYRSGPASKGFGNPFQTTVDSDGSVWLTNCNHVPGSVIHIGLDENQQCKDRNGNGIIEMSTGLGNILAWPDRTGERGVASAQDECIIHFSEVNSTGTRHVLLDFNNDVWVSGTGNRAWDLIRGGGYQVQNLGEIIQSYPSIGFGG